MKLSISIGMNKRLDTQFMKSVRQGQTIFQVLVSK